DPLRSRPRETMDATRRGPGAAAEQPVKSRGLLLVIALGTILAPLNSTMIAVALPGIATDLGIGVGESTWLVVSYLIVMAVMQPIAGTLGDRYGRRQLFLGALVGFLVTSVAAAAATSFPVLVILRLAQATCGALEIPNGAALVREYVPEARRGAAYGLIGAAVGVAAGFGPPLGGGLVALGGWRMIFAVNVPVVALAILVGVLALPAHRGAARPAGRAFDFLGAVLLAGWLTTFALGASAKGGTVLGVPVGGYGLATVVLLVAFIGRELRVAAPVVQLALFREPAFAGAAAVIALGNLAMYSTLLTVPQFLTLVDHRGSAEVGIVLAALSVPLAALAPFGGHWADRWGRRPIVIVGCALTFAAFLPLLWLGPGWSSLLLAAPLAVAGCGLALQTPAVQALAIEAAPLKQAGMASGVFSTSRYLGSITGTALLAAFLGGGAVPSAAGFSAVFLIVVLAAFGALAAGIALREARP
ncbi:MAG TPA: MFS transporter, partial [Chloroflexota bacterium]|nr:MFS transporter [Chloroflexota bacterium]